MNLQQKKYFFYIYAVLNSNSFRNKFSSLLKIDFPYIPFVKDKKHFNKLSEFGEQLIAYHIFNSKMNSQVTFPKKGSNIIDQIKFDKDKSQIWINKSQYFTSIPAEAWNFEIGGYMPTQKWLKARKGRKLTYDELITYPMIINSILKTIEIQSKIDGTIDNMGGLDFLLKNQIQTSQQTL